MKQELIITIKKDGTVHTITKNIKGNSCLNYIDLIQTLIKADIYDSSFTNEYYEEVTENELIKQNLTLNK